MIHAAGWFGPEGCGFLLPDGRGQRRPAPQVAPGATGGAALDAVAPIVGRAPKYYARMTLEARYALCAASLALRGAGWRGGSVQEVGMIVAGFAGCMEADAAYFDDYVRFGRSTGRGALFIYTLPTSVAGELSIALELRGPMLHWHADRRPVAALIARAAAMTSQKEADAMLALWSDPSAAVCLAVGPDDGPAAALPVAAAAVAAPRRPAWPANLDLPPQDLARALAASVSAEI